jgi:hypothetical protein
VRYLILIVLVLVVMRLALAASGVTVTGGAVKINGGYVDIGTTVNVSSTPITELQGKCMGILCGVTYN